MPAGRRGFSHRRGYAYSFSGTRPHKPAANRRRRHRAAEQFDLIEPGQIKPLETKLQEINSTAAIVRTDRCRIDPELLFGIGRERKIAAPVRNHQHQSEFESFAFTSSKIFSRDCFERFANGLPASVVRAKGFIHFADGAQLFNFVAGRSELEPFETDSTELVFIGKKIAGKRGDLRALCECAVKNDEVTNVEFRSENEARMTEGVRYEGSQYFLATSSFGLHSSSDIRISSFFTHAIRISRGIRHRRYRLSSDWADLPELFMAAADATMNVMIDNLDGIEPRETLQIELSNDNIDLLLFDLLQELIFLKDAERLLLACEKCKSSRKMKIIL